MGEGDRAIVDVALSIDRGQDLAGVNNIAYCRDGKFVQNPLHPLVDNLDELPFKDIFPRDKFLIEDDRLIRDFGEVSYSGRYHTATARGCPFSCSYCSENYVKGMYPRQKYLRRRSPSHVIGELVEAGKTLRYRIVQFEDEVFALNADWLEAFAEMYRERIGLPFECYIYPSHRRGNHLMLLKETGLRWTCLSLQSGSDRINREVFKRHFDKTLYLETARILRGLDIAYYADVITFNPFETREDLQATLDVLLRLPGRFPVFVNKLYLIEGTAIHDAVRNAKGSPDLGRVTDRTFRHYSRLFHAAGHYPKSTVYVAGRATIFEYLPFLLRLFFGLVGLSVKVAGLGRAAKGYISGTIRPAGLPGKVDPRQANAQTPVPVGQETLFSVDLIDDLQPARHGFCVAIDAYRFKVIPVRRDVAITGWAVDQRAGTTAAGVFIDIGGRREIAATYGLDRPDVADHFGNRRYRFSGFEASIRISMLKKGENILSLKVLTADGKGYYSPKLKMVLDVR